MPTYNSALESISYNLVQPELLGCNCLSIKCTLYIRSIASVSILPRLIIINIFNQNVYNQNNTHLNLTVVDIHKP